MKKLVWLLVLLNIALLAYFNLECIFPSVPKVALAEINPEKIKMLSPSQISALPQKTTSTAGTLCYEWGIFSTASLSNAQAAAANLSLSNTVKEKTSLEAKRYWVYQPSVKSAEAAQANALKLKALGIQELFVMQNSPWKNAISFGIFEDEQLATHLFNELKNKGVKNIVKALRNQDSGHASLLFNALTDDKVVELKKLKSDFPEAYLKETTCQ